MILAEYDLSAGRAQCSRIVERASPRYPHPMDNLSSFSVPLPPEFAARLSAALRAALDKSGWRFSCEGDEFTSEEITAPDGLLPMWIHRGQSLMRKAMGGNAGDMAFRIDGKALCGVLPEPQADSASLPVWACFVHFALEEWRGRHAELAAKGAPVPMDELYQNWRTLVQSNQVQLLPPLPQAQPGLQGLGPSVPLNPTAETVG